MRTTGQRGRLAEEMVPVAAQLVGAVRDDGPDEVAAVLRSVAARNLDALAVVLAAMVDPDMSPAELLAWVTWDEHGRPLEHGPMSYKVAVSDEVRAGHAAFEKARRLGQPVPGHVREFERFYQRVRAQRRRAEQAA